MIEAQDIYPPQPLSSTYTQVELVRQDDGGGLYHYVCWVPTKFAEIDGDIRIREHGQWGPKWTVKQVFSRISASNAAYLVEYGYRRFQRVLGSKSKWSHT